MAQVSKVRRSKEEVIASVKIVSEMVSDPHISGEQRDALKAVLDTLVDYAHAIRVRGDVVTDVAGAVIDVLVGKREGSR